MAELAAGAVHSLLGLIRNEALLLDSVRADVQFIKEEMESMNSFLLHLARTAPPGGEHDEQVRTWMKQVRDLAHDCSNCIDLYLQRGDPEIHRARGLRGYALWVAWFVQKIVAQHRAATQLRELKNRARDVGERRLRYGVEVPAKAAAKKVNARRKRYGVQITGAASSSQASGGGDEGIMPSDDEQTPKDEEDDHNEPETPADDAGRRDLAFSEARILERCTEKLVKWLNEDTSQLKEDAFQLKLRSIAIAAQDIDDARDIAREALETDFESKAIKIEEDSFQRRPQEPGYILSCIVWELLVQYQQQDTVQELIAGFQGKFGVSKTRIKNKIEEIQGNIKKYLENKRPNTSAELDLEPLGMFLLQQQLLPPKPEPRQDKSVEEEGKTVKEIATKLKEHMEASPSPFALDPTQYVHILLEVFPSLEPKEQEGTNTDKMKQQIIEKVKQEILQGKHPMPQEDKSVEEATDNLSEDQIKDIEQKITGRIKEIQSKIEDQVLIKLFVDEIQEYLSLNSTLRIIILQHLNDPTGWKKIRRALSLLHCADGSAVTVIVTTNNTQKAKEFCYPERAEPIICSLVGVYHDIVLQLTNRQMKDDEHDKTFHRILDKCEPHEFCMQIFARALYANPNRSLQELQKLQRTLVRQGPLGRNARRMFKFSYNDLPREYKVCLLYLAIFPPGHNIKRSTLIGRWVAEGLITKEDWPSSVRQAEQCFDDLIDRWLVHPGDIGAVGKVKSCMVHDVVHEFISKIAKKEHFVDTRLSHHFAHHFSVLSDVRLRSSDSIEKFLQNLYRMPQLPLVKVLDLEDCQCFEKNQHYIKNIFKKNQHYLKNICNKMLLLKYLSLRNTNITKLPTEINNLHQLEVLDIRHTHLMTASATRHLVLLKLKRLLAGCIHPSPSCPIKANKSFSAARLPRRIGKMTNMEVLSHVEASQHAAELKDIGNLWQLRKLDVVIHDKKAHLKNLIRVIGDLSESLQSLSICIKPLQARSHGTPSNTDIRFENPPKLLESLSISGITTSGQLLPLLVKHCGQLANVTLRNTHLKQDNMKDLGQSAKFRCVRLRHESYTESKLTFKKEEFQNLKYLLVEGSNMTDISFEDRAAPELEKIVLSMADINNISFGNGAATQLEKIVLSSISISSITFANGAAPKLNEITLSFTKITSITFENGATPNLKRIIFGDTTAPQLERIFLSSTINGITFTNGAAPKLEEIVLSSTNITRITFENGATPNLKKIVLFSFTNVEFLSGINYLPGLKELELNGSRIASALLSLFANADQIAKVTLRDTFLKQGDLQILAKQPNLCFLMLLDKSCDERQLTFNKEEFQNLKLLVVECFSITEISFAKGAAPKLGKIVWSFTDIHSLSGIDNLRKLKELEFKGDKIPNQVREAIAAHRNRPVLKHTQQKNQEKEEEAEQQRILD